MKRTKRVDAARSKVAPVAVSLAQTASEKVKPAAQSAAALAVPLAQQAYSKAGPLAQQAYDKAVPLAAGAAAVAVPLAHQAYEKAAPLAGQAAQAVSPYAQAVADRVSPYTDRAVDAVTPYAQQVSGRLVPLAAGGLAVAQDAAERVGPALETARDRVSDELLPRLSTAVTTAAASPLAVEAVRRGRATAAAARGELSLPEPKQGGSWVKRLAVVAAIAGVAVLVGRRLVGGTPDSGWQAARPSTPSEPPAPSPAPASTAPGAAAPEVGTFGTAEADAPETDPQVGLNAHQATLAADGAAEPDQPAEGGDAEVGDEAPLAGEEAASTLTDATEITSGYGEGSYVGAEPPAGFVIKGNENSMKYHLPGGGGYDQTIAEVWFDSADAAERAGFTRALG